VTCEGAGWAERGREGERRAARGVQRQAVCPRRGGGLRRKRRAAEAQARRLRGRQPAGTAPVSAAAPASWTLLAIPRHEKETLDCYRGPAAFDC